MNNLLKNIRESQTDCKKLEKMLSDFNPLILKYAKKLNYEDAYNDILVLFIEMLVNLKTDYFIPSEDQYVLSYISKAAHNIFIRCLSKKKYQNYEFQLSNLSDASLQQIENDFAYIDSYDEIELHDLKKILNEREFDVIYNLIFQEKNLQEVALQQNVSRQYISKLKINALNKIKKYYYNYFIN